ncbi:MAG TPA: hypothetical protein VH740_16560 [Vicinamibacterales bacterium]|jgi:hypothetical protein
MNTHILVLAIAAIAIVPSTSGAQPAPQSDATETNRAPIIPFLEATDVFWTLQNGGDGRSRFPSALEADIFPHLVAYQNFTDIVDIEKQQQKGAQRIREFAMSISGTPAVRIRMTRDVSRPVRTPSYMPRGNVQFLWARGLKENVRRAAMTADVSEAFSRLPNVGLWEAHFIIGHHSNGQDGCITVLQERIPAETGDCFPSGIVPTRETINKVDGSFSTNYFRAGINYSRNWMANSTKLEAVKEVRFRAEIEHHPRAWVDEDIVDLIGRTRLNVNGAFAVKDVRPCRKRLEGSIGAVVNPGVVDSDQNLSFSVYPQFSCFPWENGGWGFFVRFYSGQDYYNIGFLERINRLHFGATFNQSGFFRFRKKA